MEVRFARGEVVALIDSDNILPERDWFRRMVGPFGDEEIA
jgi:cellulose synthase/poly-beta-1,6-N-acetylglucosamine synthase-like glycosyltransferase